MKEYKNIKEVMDLFEDGENRFAMSPMFNKVVCSLMNGADPIKIIDALVKISDENTKRTQNILEAIYNAK